MDNVYIPCFVIQIVILCFTDLKELVAKETSNIPHLALVVDSNQPIQLYVIVERILLDYTTDVATGICGLIAAYFAFNITYPGALRPILIFLQHVMLGIVTNNLYPL